MATRKTVFAVGETYHVFNRGVDKRDIFMDRLDSERFLRSMIAFNTKEPVKSLFLAELLDAHSAVKPPSGGVSADPLVEIVAYCLNPNHFHLILRQVSDGGISEFMKRLSGGYTWYFNNKYDRTGSLFQGTFKSVHVDVNEYLLHLSVYVNLNSQVHGLGGLTAEVTRSSFGEYQWKSGKEICSKEIVLGQFSSRSEYIEFARRTFPALREKKLLAEEYRME
jgi:REP element-mobilizing transposase RayT